MVLIIYSYIIASLSLTLGLFVGYATQPFVQEVLGMIERKEEKELDTTP